MRSRSGSLAMLGAIRRASSRVRSLVAIGALVESGVSHYPSNRREDHGPHHVEKNDAHNFSSCSLLLCTQLVERLERRANLLAVLGIRIHILKPVH